MRYSVRPRSDGVRTARVAGTVSCSLAGRPAMARIIGATNVWKVKMAEVGKPGSTTTGRPSVTAMHNGLPGLSATPWMMIPGRSSRPTAWWARSPAPFEVPPESRTMSEARACSSRAPQLVEVVPADAQRHGLATLLRDRGAEDRGVGIVDLAGPDRLARRNQLVARGDDGDGWPAMDRHLGQPDRRQHADLA